MTTEATYRNSSISGATPIGLMIALFDALVRDLRRAVDAIHREDVETRCRELNHALLVIGLLESWVNLENGGESARQIALLYRYLRAKLMEASIWKSAVLLEAQIETILHVRSRWQLLDCAPEPLDRSRRDAATALGSVIPAVESDSERVPFSQTA